MDAKKPSGIQIAVREAPFRQFVGRREPSIVEFPPWAEGKSLIVDHNEYNFDHAFPSNATQAQVHDTLILPLIEKVLQGYQCTALAYGQTGTGKSYSMGMTPSTKILKPEQIGILPRCLNTILDRLAIEEKENCGPPITVSASFIEIYNEKAYDLLGSSPDAPMMPSRCNNCTCLPLASQQDLQRLLHRGTTNRKVRATLMNATSSRSHAIVTIHLWNGSQHARMNIVDLAGSEGVRRTANVGAARQEGVNINLGLLGITKVVMSMTLGHTRIPYRDSVLTTVLQESLTAKSYITFLACISPHSMDLNETVTTLRFATTAKKLRLNPQQMQQKQSFAAKEPHAFRPPLGSSTVIKRRRLLGLPEIDQTVLQRTRSDLGQTPKAKKRARELLKMDESSDCSLEALAVTRPVMPVLPEPAGAQNEELTLPYIDTSSYQLYGCNASSIHNITQQQELTGIQPLQESVEEVPQPRPLRRSTRLLNRRNSQDTSISTTLQSSCNLRSNARLEPIQENPIHHITTIYEIIPPAVKREEGKGRRIGKKAASSWLESHRKKFLELLNNGSVKELSKVPAIGQKIALSLTMHR
ncbi:hypothetical protein KR018_008039 [Drosophila ironensis]|nr:hypothetical protein KR018_008039 [Drosophila ironensis]